MSSSKEQPKNIADIADDARALMEATAEVTGQKVERARKRLARALTQGEAMREDMADASADSIEKLSDLITVALHHGKTIYDKVHDDVVSRAKAADHTVRENPYRVMGIALGVGTIAGFILSCRHSRNGH